MTPKISVVAPVYRVEDYLDICVQSILDQSFADFELILIDDGSPDNCPAMCDAWAEKDCRVKVIHKENGGPQAAANAGIIAASADYITFVDSDDWVENSFLSVLYNGITSNNADIVQCNFRRMYGEKELYRYVYPAAVYDEEYIKTVLVPDILYGKMTQLANSRCNKMYNCKLVKSAIKYVDETISMGEDLLMNFACLMECRKVVVMETEPLYNYRNNTESLSSTYNKKNKYAKERFYQNYKNILAQHSFPITVDFEAIKQKRLGYYIYECAISQMNIGEKTDEIKEILSMLDKRYWREIVGGCPSLAAKVCLQMARFGLVSVMVAGVDLVKKLRRLA